MCSALNVNVTSKYKAFTHLHINHLHAQMLESTCINALTGVHAQRQVLVHGQIGMTYRQNSRTSSHFLSPVDTCPVIKVKFQFSATLC